MTCCECMISYKYEQALPSNRHVLPGFVRNDFTTIVKKKNAPATQDLVLSWSVC